jgi:hypothetical protein
MYEINGKCESAYHFSLTNFWAVAARGGGANMWDESDSSATYHQGLKLYWKYTKLLLSNSLTGY